MPSSSKVQKRSGRQPLGLVSANNAYLHPRYSISIAKANARGGYDVDDVSVASSTASRYSYRGIKHKLSKKKRGLISSILEGGNKIGIGRKGGKSSSTSSSLSSATNDRLLEEDANAPSDGFFAYEDIENSADRGVWPMREDVEDGNSLKRESNIAPKLEVVNPECRAISRPRVICDIPTNVVSPSWSEYGSAMLETWGVLEKAASFIDHSIHDVSDDGTNDDFAKKGPNNDDFEDAKESGVFDSVLAHDSMYGTHRHREAESTSLSSPPREKFLNIDQGGGPTSPDYCPPGDVSCEDHTYSEIAPSTDLTSDYTQVVGPLSIEIKRDDGTIDPSKPKSAFDREEVNIDNLESGTTRYIAMDDAATASSLIQCFAPLTQGASPISPPMIAMAFGCAVILLHIIWVASSKF